MSYDQASIIVRLLTRDDAVEQAFTWWLETKPIPMGKVRTKAQLLEHFEENMEHSLEPFLFQDCLKHLRDKLEE